jgi:CRP-like cAMP-binding protein
MSSEKSAEVKKYQAGDMIIEQGDPSDCAFQINAGAVEVFLNKDGKIVTLATLGKGEIFGENALFGEGISNANVKAAKNDTELAVITCESFKHKLEKCDPMVQKILTMMIHRLHGTNEALLHSETREFMDIDFIED